MIFLNRNILVINFSIFLIVLNCKKPTKQNMEYDPEVLDGKGGDVIAFYSERDGNSEIYIMNADGGAETRLTNNVDQDITPVLSTDGSQILFVSNRGGQRDIYRMKYDGTNVTRQTNNSGNNFWPSWALSDGIQ